MACEYNDLVKEVVWDTFLKQLKKYVLKKFGKKAAAALGTALADGPLPIGDIVSVLLLLWGVVDTVWDLGDFIENWTNFKKYFAEKLLDAISGLKKEFGEKFLDNPCMCECFKKYLKDLVWASCGATPAEVRTRRRVALRRLRECIRKCA